MAKPNYQFEKRARELAKKQKKEDKLKRRQEKAAAGDRQEGADTSISEPSDDSSDTSQR